jgi:hypothetical protein
LATGLQARFNAAQDPVFLALVGEAVAEAAVAIYNEGTGVAGHVARAAYATKVLNSPAFWDPMYQRAFAAALATQGLDATSLDPAIATGVASVWNALAGA